MTDDPFHPPPPPMPAGALARTRRAARPTAEYWATFVHVPGKAAEGEAPADPRKRAQLLIDATAGMDAQERAWAAGEIEARGYAHRWTPHRGVECVTSLAAWDETTAAGRRVP